MVHSTNQSVLISVIVPLYNAEKFVSNALISILQECPLPLEVIIVNDGCTDASLDEIERIGDKRIRLIDNTSKGIASAMNAGLKAARGEFIMRCDADDLYPHQRLTEQVNWLKNNPEFGAVCGGYSVIDSKGVLVIEFNCGSQAEEITHELQNGITRTHFCTFAMRTSLLNQLGGFREYFATGEDIDFQLRFGDSYRVWYNPSIYYFYRLHSSSVTHTISSSKREFFDKIARSYQVQRRLEGSDDIQRGCPVVPPMSKGKRPFTASDHIQELLLFKAWKKYESGHRLEAIATGFRSAMIRPGNLEVWRCLLVLAIKPS